MFADLRYALGQLAKSPGFSIPVILTLAVGIGANTASILHGGVFHPMITLCPHSPSAAFSVSANAHLLLDVQLELAVFDVSL